MKGLTYFAAMAVLAAALIFAQSSTPSSDPSNSSHPSAQSQNSAGASDQDSRHNKAATKQGPDSPNATPDTTIRDQQGSTASTTGASGQTNQPSTSTLGTAASTPGTGDQAPQGNTRETLPEGGTSTDQQPNSSISPSSAPPQAYLNQTPAVRAVSTHTPDPGTCMNPAALETAADGGQRKLAPSCN